MIEFPKVLVAAPTAIAKKYCFDDWLYNVLGFTYPNYNVILFDNTGDNGEFTNDMNVLCKYKYGFDYKFLAVDSLSFSNSTTLVIEVVSNNNKDESCAD